MYSGVYFKLTEDIVRERFEAEVKEREALRMKNTKRYNNSVKSMTSDYRYRWHYLMAQIIEAQSR
jgi:hypothetical protein